MKQKHTLTANAVGKVAKEDKELTEQVRLRIQGMDAQRKAFEEFKSKIKTVEMPKLAYYKRIGYGRYPGYREFGEKVWNTAANEHAKLGDVGWDIRLSPAFAKNKAWQRFSTAYYPQVVQKLYSRLNDYFSFIFVDKMKEICNAKKEERSKAELALKKYLENDFLDNYITEVIREDEENKQDIFDCLKSFVLFPQQVLGYQFTWVNNVERQEGTPAAAMKSYINDKKNMFNVGRYSKAINFVNEEYSKINKDNREFYEQAMRRLSQDDFSKILSDNITAAHGLVSTFDANDVGISISNDYTQNVITSGVHDDGDAPNYSGDGNTDIQALLAGGAILAAIYFAKKGKA